MNNILKCGYPPSKISYSDVKQPFEDLQIRSKRIQFKKVYSNSYSKTVISSNLLKRAQNLMSLRIKNVVRSFDVHLKHEITKGSSYCEVDGVVKQLSFVYVANTENDSKTHSFDKEVRTDSRGSCIDLNSKGTKRYVTPAYLVVFELNNQNY